MIAPNLASASKRKYLGIFASWLVIALYTCVAPSTAAAQSCAPSQPLVWANFNSSPSKTMIGELHDAGGFKVADVTIGLPSATDALTVVTNSGNRLSFQSRSSGNPASNPALGLYTADITPVTNAIFDAGAISMTGNSGITGTNGFKGYNNFYNFTIDGSSNITSFTLLDDQMGPDPLVDYIDDYAPGATLPTATAILSLEVAGRKYFDPAFEIAANFGAIPPGDTIRMEFQKLDKGSSSEPALNVENHDMNLYVTGCIPKDRSDAPADGSSAPASGTTSYGEATHTIVSGIQLGAAVDHEYSFIGNANADGEGADDDGISAFPTLSEGDASYTIPAGNITATGTGTLYAWIDFDGDGAFGASEFTSVAVSGGTPAGDLTWTGQTTMAAGTTFARFRFTSDTLTSADFATDTSDGEAEDYALAVTGGLPSLDVTKVATYSGGTIADGTTDNLPAGTVVTYTYTVTNSGTQTISDISVADVHGGYGPPPTPDIDGATLTDNGTTGDSSDATPGDGVWDTLGPGDQLTITATYTVVQEDVDNHQ